MGYDSRLYIVNKFDNADRIDFYDDGYHFAEVIASFELCKAPEFREQIAKYDYTDCYIYADDGSSRIMEDEYGEKLKEIPLSSAVDILKECVKVNSWWRYEACLAMLEGLAGPGADAPLTVLHYGH